MSSPANEEIGQKSHPEDEKIKLGIPVSQRVLKPLSLPKNKWHYLALALGEQWLPSFFSWRFNM